MKRLFGMGFGMAWATVSVAAAEPEAPKPLFFPSGKPVFPAQKPADKPAKAPTSGVTQAVYHSPAGYGSFNGGAVQQATPAATPTPTIVRTQATVAVPAPMPAVKPTPVVVAAPKPAPAPVMMAPAPTATPAPTYTVLPTVTPSTTVLQAKPMYPLLAANATGYPVTPTIPQTYIAPTSYQAAPMPMAAPVPAPMPAPVPAPAPSPAFAPATISGDCGSCQSGCDSRGFLSRFRDWLCYKPCPPIAPKCIPSEYQAPLMAYFPCKPEPCPNYQCCDTGHRSLLGGLRGRTGSCDTGCEQPGCGTCNPCGGRYPTVAAWFKATFGSSRRSCDTCNTGYGYGYPTPMMAPTPVAPAPAPAVAPTPMPMPMPTVAPNAQTTSAPPSAEWLAGYRFAVANGGRNPMKNTAPTVLPPETPRMPQPAATQTPTHMASQPQFQLPLVPRATPVSVTQPFTNP